MTDEPRPLVLAPGEALSAATRDGGVAYFEVTRRVGEGGSGVVHEAVTDDGRLAIVKGPRLVGARDPSLERELELLTTLPPHPSVVPLLGVVRSPRGHVLLVLERFFDNPFLRLNAAAVRPRVEAFVAPGARHAALPPATALELGYELALALEHLHAHKVAHCDVKPTNLMVALDWPDPELPDREYFERVAAGRWRAALIDLGAARAFRELDPGAGRQGVPPPLLTPVYAPPEVLPGFVDEAGRERSRYTPWIDSYAFGLTLYQLLTGAVPYGHLAAPLAERDLAALAEVKREEREGGLRPLARAALDAIAWGDSAVEGCTREELTTRLWDLLERTTHWDPAKRPTARRLRVDLGGLLRVEPRAPEPDEDPRLARTWRQTRLRLDAFSSRLALAARDGAPPRADLGKLRRGGADFWEREGYRAPRA